MKKKILLSAYAISPDRGSEYGVAWNIVTILAKQHEVWVLFGMSDDHMGDTQTLLQYIKDNPEVSVNFLEVKGGRIANTINLLNKAGMGWFFYLAYYIWQKKALQVARKVLDTVDIDVVHQLGPIGFREPGFLWKLNKPMVWGPIGGMIAINKKLLKGKPLLTRLKFSFKKGINYMQLNYSKRIKEAFAHADVLIAATVSGQVTIKEKFGRESYYQPEITIMNLASINESKFGGIDQQVQLVWSGSHIERKNLQMCLNALAKVKSSNWILNVLGSGPLTPQLKLKAAELNISDRVIWHGHLERNVAVRVMAQSHLHIITSIAEDNTTVVFEAMSHGVPTLTIDHCGMGDVICDKCGIKVPLDDYDVMIKTMAATLSDLLATPQILVDLAHTTLQCAEQHTWDKRLVSLNNMYKKAITLHGNRSGHSVIEGVLSA